MHLTPGKASKVKAPIIVESPLHIECRITEIKPLGSHDMFIADVVNVKADQSLINARTGAFLLEKADQLAYSHGNYFVLGKKIGKFGFSVEKKRRRK
jgi:flavin reductase (DIM6/NTAB) family NADH-FMN oxidoreductase RutF